MRGKFKAGLLASALALVTGACMATPAIAQRSARTDFNSDSDKNHLNY